MQIDWKNSNEYYNASLEEGVNKVEAVKELIQKILELSTSARDWNSIVLDKWAYNLGRLIGNIQNDKEPIGKDRGYRVSLQFLEYYNKLKSSEQGEEYSESLDWINEDMEDLVFELLGDEAFKKKIKIYHDKNPFVIEIAEQGQRTGIALHFF